METPNRSTTNAWQTLTAMAALALACTVSAADAGFVIHLNTGALDTRQPLSAPATATDQAAAPGKRLRLVQFNGPVKPEWRQALVDAGERVVCHIPENCYLVYGENKPSAQASFKAAAKAVQWQGDFLPAYKVAPSARKMAADAPDGMTYWMDVQLVEDKADDSANPQTLKALRELSGREFRRLDRNVRLGLINVTLLLPMSKLDAVAALPDVLSVALYIEPELHCERQAQIVSDNVVPGGARPTGPGYLAWLKNKGFNQQQFMESNSVTVVVDDGFDNGDAYAPANSEFRVGNNPALPSRMAFANIGIGASGFAPDGVDGHGNINLSIVGGYNDGEGIEPNVDSEGFHYGLGISPFARMASTKIFNDYGGWAFPDEAAMVADQYWRGCRISSNSWGARVGGAYTVECQNYDSWTRDADPGTPGNQELMFVFSAGNSGANSETIGSPGSAKNVMAVGAAENYDPYYTDGCDVSPEGADNANDIIDFSSRGPCADGRSKPEIVAPGTHIHGAASYSPKYTGYGVCDKYNPNDGQTKYAESSGTSHSCPAVAGGVTLIRQYFVNHDWQAPSPAMTKAYLMSSTRYLNGVDSGDDLWSNNQGMGNMSLAIAFDGTPRVIRDQLTEDMFTASGQELSWNHTVADSSKPVRVTLAWTDAPGSIVGAAYNNDLNLEVTVGGKTYLGNHFSGAFSAEGGDADFKNNVESVFLPAGTAGDFQVRVVARDINSDGVPGNISDIDQDFALVVYNTAGGDTGHVVAFTADFGGSLYGESTQQIANGAACSAVTALPSKECAFLNWTGPDGFISTDNPLIVSNVVKDMGFTAHFTTTTYFNIVITADVGGSLKGNATQSVPYGGNSAAVTAVPDEGYTFYKWNGSYSGTANPLILTNVREDVAATAEFEVKRYDLIYTAAKGGFIDGENLQNVAHGQSGSAVAAAPYADYYFTAWSDGVATASRTDANVTANVTATALFSLWKPAASLATARYEHTATSLTDGKVLAAGGLGVDYAKLSSCELYDPATNAWTPAASMATSRLQHTATLLPNGTVLVAGGLDAEYNLLSSCELYNPATDTWTPAASMATAKYEHTPTLLPDGRVLVTGGYGADYVLSSCELYDPATNAWTPTASMATAKYEHTATLLPGGIVLVAGGQGVDNIILSSCELYDPTIGAWTPTTSMVSARYLHTATLLPDGTVLAAGGFDANHIVLSSCELYDPATGAWTPAASMATARHLHTATLLLDGTVLAVGGYYDASYITILSCELYNYASGLWTLYKPMNIPRYNHTASLLPNGRVLVAGGENDYNALSSCILSDLFLSVSFAADSSRGAIQGETRQFVREDADTTPVSAVPNIGFSFVNWTGTGGFQPSQSNPLTIDTVRQEMAITANFAINTYTLAYAAGAGGSIRGANPQSVTYGGSGSAVTAVQDTGYHFTSWSDGVATVVRTDSNVAADKSVTASFVINSYTLSYTSGVGGSISGVNPQTAQYGGSSSTVTAVTSTGFRFIRWTLGAAEYSTSPTLTVLDVKADMAFTAVFGAAAETPTLTMAASPSEAGTVSPSAPTTVEKGAVVPVSAKVSSGYVFDLWDVQPPAAGFVASPSSTETTVALLGDATLTALFKEIPASAMLTVVAEPSICASMVLPRGASQVPTSAPVALSAAPSGGYAFVSWAVDSGSASIADLAAASTSATLTGDSIVRAVFTLTGPGMPLVTVSASSGGDVSPSGTSQVKQGSYVSLMAKPSASFRFIGWTVLCGDVSLANPYSQATMAAPRSDCSVLAQFAPQTWTATLKVSASNGGAASPSQPLAVLLGQAVPISARPAGAFYFERWQLSGNASAAEGNSLLTPVTAISLNGDTLATAVFQELDDGQGGRIVVDSNTAKLGNDSTSIDKMPLALDPTTFDPASDVIAARVGDFAVEFSALDCRVSGTPAQGKVTYQSNNSAAFSKRLVMDFKRRLWAMTASGAAIAGKVQGADGVEVSLVASSWSWGALFNDIRQTVSWSFSDRQNGQEPLPVGGGAPVSIIKSGGKVGSSISISSAQAPKGLPVTVDSKISVVVGEVAFEVPSASIKGANGRYKASWRTADGEKASFSIDSAKGAWTFGLSGAAVIPIARPIDGVPIYLNVDAYSGGARLWPSVRTQIKH